MVDRIELVEYQPRELPRHAIAEETGRWIWEKYRDRILIEFPNPATQQMWRFTSQGWVGHIPVNPDLGISIAPKVPISNVFRMLEYAYRLGSFEILDDLYEAHSLQEFYEELAAVLAKRIMARGRKGFYRGYLDRIEQTRFIRGGLEIEQLIRQPWKLSPVCRFQDHTPDLVENQILTWSLFVIARSGLCSERTSPIIRRAFRMLHGITSLIPFVAADCLGNLYHRLNEDYQPLHALCRFFLDNSGPTHTVGESAMMPFLVNMANLFELFVYEWLSAHLPKGFHLAPQETIELSAEGGLQWRIDLVLRDDRSDRPRMVLDTKYKDTDTPSADDIAQIVAYAQVKRCYEAVLVYPRPLSSKVDYWADDIRVRTAAFRLDGEIEDAGQEFMRELQLA